MNACRENAGKITWLRSNLAPCICIIKHGRWQWEQLRCLSANNFITNRSTINASIDTYLQEIRDIRRNISVKIVYEPRPEEYKFMQDLFNNLDIKTKKEKINTFKNTTLAKKFCSVCFSFIMNPKKQCIHRTCVGMCSSCYNKMEPTFDICIACNNKQELECPICTDMFPSERLAKFKPCKHVTCFKCALHHCQVKDSAFKKCPLCREKITIEF